MAICLPSPRQARLIFAKKETSDSAIQPAYFIVDGRDAAKKASRFARGPSVGKLTDNAGSSGDSGGDKFDKEDPSLVVKLNRTLEWGVSQLPEEAHPLPRLRFNSFSEYPKHIRGKSTAHTGHGGR